MTRAVVVVVLALGCTSPRSLPAGHGDAAEGPEVQAAEDAPGAPDLAPDLIPELSTDVGHLPVDAVPDVVPDAARDAALQTPDLAALDAPPAAEAFVATLSGANEVPPNTSGATGTATLTVTADPTMFDYDVRVVFPPIAVIGGANLHKAPPGSNGPAVGALTIFGAKSTGRAELVGATIADLRAGNVYLNVRTTTLPAGEIRGWFK